MLSSPSLMALNDNFADDFQGLCIFSSELAPELWIPISNGLFYASTWKSRRRPNFKIFGVELLDLYQHP